jgi:hypothetical protein
MSDLSLNDFIEQLNTSASIANNLLQPEEMKVQIIDEEGNVYDITDVKFNVVTRTITIEFDHDNEEYEDTESVSDYE